MCGIEVHKTKLKIVSYINYHKLLPGRTFYANMTWSGLLKYNTCINHKGRQLAISVFFQSN